MLVQGRQLIQEELQRAWAMLREQGDLEAVFQRRNLTLASSPPHPDPLTAAAGGTVPPSHDGLNRSAGAAQPEKASVPASSTNASSNNSSASSCFASSASNTSAPASDDCSPACSPDAATESPASSPAPPVLNAAAEVVMQGSESESEQDGGGGEALRADDVRDEKEASDAGDGVREGRRRQSGRKQGVKRRRQGDSGMV